VFASLRKLFFTVGRVRFAKKIIFLLWIVLISLLKQFSYSRTCSLRFENMFILIKCVCFASKIIFLQSNMFALLRYRKIPIIEAFVRFRFDIVAITNMYHFNFVTLNASCPPPPPPSESCRHQYVPKRMSVNIFKKESVLKSIFLCKVAL
jgi:hypothetical protein